jgi:CRP-like cAMP-binding protein
MTSPSTAELQAVPLFGGLPESEIEALTDWFERREVAAGDVLVREGASGYAFLILGSAHAEVRRGDEVIATLVPGDFLGEAAILGGGRRSATVAVTSPGAVYELFGTRFRELGLRHPDLQAEIERVLAERAND